MVLKELILRTFLTVSIWEGVVVLKELILNSFYTLGGCGGLKDLLFSQFPLWEGVVVLTELIFNSFKFRVLGRCGGGLERPAFFNSLYWEFFIDF